MTSDTIAELKKSIRGDIDATPATLTTYSHDASLFEIRPQVVVYPKDSADIQTLVHWVNTHKKADPTLSITMRAAGTDMSGGSIGASILVDVTRYMNKILSVTTEQAIVEPGCYYRDFEKETLKLNRILPSYTASKDICAVGGMVANNSGGEKTLKYGKTEQYIKSLNVIFTDGNEYTVRPLTITELQAKISAKTFESTLYRKLWDLINAHYDEIMSAKPTVSKNSSGYYLWNVYDKTHQTFDLCRLICGSQGTLGIITQITFKLVEVHKYSSIVAVFLPTLDHLSELVNEVLPFKPDSLESYDDYSMKLAIRFFGDFYKQLGFRKSLKLGFQFLPEAWMLLTGGVPKLILMIECSGDSETEVHARLVEINTHIAHFGYRTRVAKNSEEAEKYWRIRHESFNLLRKHVKGTRTAPFIDDIIVKPEFLPEFLPQIQKLLTEYKLIYTIAGHAGDGNFHIIPLMNLKSPFSADIILELSRKVYTLVLKYHGSITAEHNDGIIRTPYLSQMFGQKIVGLFQETKNIFDPSIMLNPGKKVGGTFADISKYMAKTN